MLETKEEEALAFRIDLRVKGAMNDFETVLPIFPSSVLTIDINPADKSGISLCQIKKDDKAVVIHFADYGYPPLEKGKIYELELQFFGKNFIDRKVRKLKFDISTWEKIGFTLD